MPRADWNLSRGTVADFDRESQFRPYAGPEVPGNRVYQFRVKVLKRTPATKEKLPQLRIGLELVPRASRPDEKKYRGFFIMEFAPVADNTAFRFVPFLDAIGVSESDFFNRTIVDEQGNIKRIGQWRMDGEAEVLALITDGEDQRGKPRKEVGAIMSLEDDSDDLDDADDDIEYDDDDSEGGDNEDGDEDDGYFN